jgi:hypothetical protein
MALGLLIAVAATPLYLAFEGAKALRRLARTHSSNREPMSRGRARAELELREQYASGYLSLVGLEERLSEVLRAGEHFELDSVLEDLPPRPVARQRVAIFEAVAGIGLLLVLHSTAGRAAGAALALGSVIPPARWRVVLLAFLAGIAVVAAPLAAAPLAVGAGWRWLDGRTQMR